MKRLDDYLQKLGLKKREREVYLAIVKLGQASVPRISKEIKLSRESVYQSLDELKALGLIEIDLKKYGRKVYARDPKAVLDLVRKRERNLKKVELGLKDILPEIRQEFKGFIGPKLRYYETTEEIQKVTFDICNASNKMVYFFTTLFSFDMLGGPKAVNKFIEKLVESGIEEKIIRSPLVRTLKKDYPDYKFYNDEPGDEPAKFNREIRVAPPKFDFKSNVYIYDDNILVLGKEDDKFAFKLNSKTFAEMFRKIFELVWELSESIG